MLDKLTYISSTNKRIEFGSGNILINTNNFRDYEWKYSNSFKRIANFTKDVTPKTLPVLIFGDDTKLIANEIFDIIEEDVLTEQYGRIYSGDFYMQGYFIGSSKASYTVNGILKLNLTFVTDKPYWIRELKYSFSPSDIVEGELDYPYDYPYDYAAIGASREIINPSFISQDVEIVMHGPFSLPYVYIGDNTYHLSVSNVQAGNRVVINTMDKTIVNKKADGTIVNLFNTRSRTNYIFEKVQSGIQSVSFSPNSMNVDITILEKRSEPQW